MAGISVNKLDDTSDTKNAFEIIGEEFFISVKIYLCFLLVMNIKSIFN